MNDLISRQAAIDALGEGAMVNYQAAGHGNGLIKAIDVIKGLPSAQPETEEGEWIPEFNGKFTGGAYWFSCSKCKRIVPEVRNGGWNFCPTCGAKMDAQGEE